MCKVKKSTVKQVGNIVDDTAIGFKNPQRGRVYSVEGISPALNCCQGGGLEPKIIVKEATKKEKYRWKQFKVNGEPMFTLTSQDRHGVEFESVKGIAIRKLTPKECFRLQGWSDEYFYKAQQFNSDSQLYKQAGNGVTVNVINAIAKELTNE